MNLFRLQCVCRLCRPCRKGVNQQREWERISILGLAVADGYARSCFARRMCARHFPFSPCFSFSSSIPSGLSVGSCIQSASEWHYQRFGHLSNPCVQQEGMECTTVAFQRDFLDWRWAFVLKDGFSVSQPHSIRFWSRNWLLSHYSQRIPFTLHLIRPQIGVGHYSVATTTCAHTIYTWRCW